MAEWILLSEPTEDLGDVTTRYRHLESLDLHDFVNDDRGVTTILTAELGRVPMVAELIEDLRFAEITCRVQCDLKHFADPEVAGLWRDAAERFKSHLAAWEAK